MRHLSRLSRRAGFTLVELIVAITISGLVMGSIYKILAGNQRFYQAQNQIMDVQQNIRAVAQILPGELRGLDPDGGDIIAMSDNAITIRAMRAFSVLCDTLTAANVTARQITIRNSLTSGYRAMDATRDSVLVFREGNPQLSNDDKWLHAPIAGSTSANCADGSAGTRLTLTGMVNGDSLGVKATVGDRGVLLGAPLRTFEVVNYLLYDDGTGTWWLGIRTHASGAWSATSPIAGPLRPTDGLVFEYRGANQALTSTTTAVRQIRITVRGRSTQRISIPGRVAGYFQDSIVARVALRNYARP
jgi:prepilin-type N-terminal cleavage/methylation domain-containing protein